MQLQFHIETLFTKLTVFSARVKDYLTKTQISYNFFERQSKIFWGSCERYCFPDFLFSPFMYNKHHLCIDRQLTLCVKFVSYTLRNMFIALEETWLNYWCSLCIKPNKWIEILWHFFVLFSLSFSSCRCLVQFYYLIHLGILLASSYTFN